MAYFHYRCGERITLLNDSCTAVRDQSEFDNGLVITAEPLLNDVLFEIKIDRKVNSWSGSLEIGVVDCDPLHFDFPPCSSKIQPGSWIMAASSFFKNGNCMIEQYGADLDKLNQDDRVGLMRTSEGDLIFYVNGESQGVAAENLPPVVYAIVDVYGKCVQVSITSPTLREHNNDDCLSGSSVLAIDNDILNVTLGGDLSELSMSSSNSLDIRMDMNVSLSLPEETPTPRPDKLRFHDRCGSLVKLSNNNRTAERRRPLDEFNNGVVMTHRPLRDSELFEIRIDRLVAKWSGSIEMGITTHNPSTLVFPATMTNMRSGTIMMSGCGILTNGKGTKREYGDFNLDELSEGDRVGMMRKPDGNLHYFINGLDQGVAAQRVPSVVWGVIDLYGMTTKVSIVERDEREEQNLITRKNTRDQQQQQQQLNHQQQQQQIFISDQCSSSQQLTEYYDRLTFHPNCGAHAEVINNGRTAHRPNAKDDFNNGVVLTARPLKLNELFEVRLDRVVTKWAGSIEIGVTTHNPIDLEFPFTMTNVRSGTWMMTGSGIMHNGTIVLENYGVNLDRLQVGDRVGVVRKDNGVLRFFVNGIDQGIAAINLPEKVYGVIDLYGQAVEASIVDMYDCNDSPDTMNASLSNITLNRFFFGEVFIQGDSLAPLQNVEDGNDLRFHHVHGKNARIINNGLTALRPRPLAEFNDAIVFSNRPLRDGELFEVILDTIVDRWSGSIELGVTAVRPDDIILPSTATDLSRDTWMLSGTSIMENSQTIKNNYPLDLDSLQAGVKLGILRTSDKILEFYRDGIPQGPACIVPNNNIYAVVDLYGQCARVSIPCETPLAQLPRENLTTIQENCIRSDITTTTTATSNLIQSTAIQTDLHIFSEYHNKNISIIDGGRLAKRLSNDINSTLITSATPLIIDELYEISLISFVSHLAGSLIIGLTEQSPILNNGELPIDSCYLIGNELRYNNRILQLFTPSLNWLNPGDRIGILRTQDGYIKLFINSEEINLTFPQLSDILYVLIDLNGACNSIAVTSHKLPQQQPMKQLQDHLEQDELLPSCSKQIQNNQNPIYYEFHENHGRNIELIDNKTIARRVASYNQGVVIVQPPLEINKKVSIIIEQLDFKWQSSLIIGIVSGLPERLNLPINALAFKSPCCIIANDWISINGIKQRSNYGQKLGNLIIGDIVGIFLTNNGLKLIINDCENELLPFIFQITTGQSMYAIFDLYGQCQQIKIINNCELLEENSKQSLIECEKADLESGEKERCNNNKLTLPIPTASTSMTSSLTTLRNNNNNTPHSPIKSLICTFKEDCVNLKKRLLLPDYYFLQTEEPICYCCNCVKSRNQTSSEKDNSLLGWVKFPLKTSTNISTDKWHTAFYSTKLGNVRAILDRGQPLTKEQAKWGSLVVQKEDDVQVVFYPTLQSCNNNGFKLLKKNNQKAHVAFQLLVKPGAYSISSRDPPEWSTKETGAIALNSLLVQISQC